MARLKNLFVALGVEPTTETLEPKFQPNIFKEFTFNLTRQSEMMWKKNQPTDRQSVKTSHQGNFQISVIWNSRSSKSYFQI